MAVSPTAGRPTIDGCEIPLNTSASWPCIRSSVLELEVVADVEILGAAECGHAQFGTSGNTLEPIDITSVNAEGILGDEFDSNTSVEYLHNGSDVSLATFIINSDAADRTGTAQSLPSTAVLRRVGN